MQVRAVLPSPSQLPLQSHPLNTTSTPPHLSPPTAPNPCLHALPTPSISPPSPALPPPPRSLDSRSTPQPVDTSRVPYPARYSTRSLAPEIPEHRCRW
eukprot:1180143-Prorocentrum_minimum.AAC.1